MTQQKTHLEKDVNGFNGHDLEDVVGPGQDGLEPELDDRPDKIKELVDLASQHFR